MPETFSARARLGAAVDLVPPPALVVLAIVSLQLGSALAVRLFAELGPLGLAGLRIGFSALMLLGAWRGSLARTARAQPGALLAFGVVIAGMNLSFYEAIARIPLGVTVAIEFLGPMTVAVCTTRRARDFLWIALALTGVALLTPEVGRGLDRAGVGFAVIAGTGWGLYVLLSQHISRHANGSAGMAIGMGVAALALLPVAVGGGLLERVTAPLMGAALVVAVFSTALPFTLEFKALRRLSARAYGVLITLEPAVAALIGALLLGQPLGARGMLAIACVSAASLGVTLSTPALPSSSR